MASRPHGHNGSLRIFAPESTGTAASSRSETLDGKPGLAEGQPKIEVGHSMQY